MGLDYYAILKIPRYSTQTEIQLAYRKWSIRAHPKRIAYPKHPENPPEGIPDGDLPFPSLTINHFWEYINEAYDVLSNNLTREVYDNYGEEGLKRGVPAPDGFIQPYSYHGDFMKTYIQFFGTFSPYSDLIDAVTHPPILYTINDGKTGVKVKDKAIEELLCLELREIFYGAVKKMKILRQEFIDEGKTVTKTKEKILVIQINPGTLPGTKICFPEEGDQGPTRIPADIHFIVSDVQHPVYLRRGSDLYMNYKIDLKQALCGFVMQIHTIDDRKLLVPITNVVQ